MTQIWFKPHGAVETTLVDTGVAGVTITKAFNGVVFRSEDGEQLAVCMRDSGFEVHYHKLSGDGVGDGFDAGWFKFSDGEARGRFTDDRTAANADDPLVAHLRKLCDLVIWMSGSSDFSPGGPGGEEWQRRRPDLVAALEAVDGDPWHVGRISPDSDELPNLWLNGNPAVVEVGGQWTNVYPGSPPKDGPAKLSADGVGCLCGRQTVVVDGDPVVKNGISHSIDVCERVREDRWRPSFVDDEGRIIPGIIPGARERIRAAIRQATAAVISDAPDRYPLGDTDGYSGKSARAVWVADGLIDYLFNLEAI